MTNITRFDPFSELSRFDPRLDLMGDPFGNLDSLFKGFMVRPVFQGASAAPQMKLEVTEDDKSYTIKADLPGVKKEDIQMSVDGKQVTIKAEVKKESEKKNGKTLLHSERYYGMVTRSFTLDKDVDQGEAKARYTDGVLEAVLPKKKNGTKSRQITVT
jgi:HSP20 family protein